MVKSSVAFPIEIAAVAFDLDGTLVETLPDLHEAANRTLKDLGRSPIGVEKVRSYVGEGVDRLVKRMLTGTMTGEPDTDVFEQARSRFREHYREVLVRASRPFPGVVPALDALRARGQKLACVTNKPEAFTLPLLEAVGLRARLDLVVAGDTLPRKKPDALPLLHCAQSFGVSAERLLMVGDSQTDIAAARAAGCPVFCVPYGYRGGMALTDLDCDAIVATVSEVLDLTRPFRS